MLRRGPITIPRIALALLLTAGWVWQERQRLGVVELYVTTSQARPGLAPRVHSYPAGAPWVCLYLVYAGARPGADHYTYRFVQGRDVIFRDVERTVPAPHGAALDCFPTGGSLAPGQYAAEILVDGHEARRIPLVVAPPITRP
jgi:hypothetical protein